MRHQIAAAATQNPVKLYSIEEVKDSLSVSRPTINRLIASGILKTCRIGRAVRIPESALIKLIEQGGKRNIQNLAVEVK